MSFIDITNQIVKQTDLKEKVVDIVTQPDITLFADMLSIHMAIQDTYNKTDSSKDFFKVFPDIKKVLGPKAEDVFYSAKLGYCIGGVPAKLVYVYTMCLTAQGGILPNLALWKITAEVKPYIDKVFVSDAGRFTVKDVLENVYMSSIPFVSDVSYKSAGAKGTEVYIENTDRIAVLPNYMASELSEENCRQIEFDTKLGLVLNGTPIRRLCNLIGITLDDYDLREVI